MVALPFFLMLFGILSVGFYFFTVFTLENAIESASRVIRTGQAQTQQPTAMTVAQFKTLVCGKLPTFVDCSNKVRINVVTAADYASATAPTCLDAGGNLIGTAAQSYSPGGASTIVLATVCYEWELTKIFKDFPYWIKPNGKSGTAMTNGSTLIKASTVMTVEPYTN